MYSPSRNNLIATGFALAGAGVVACAGALLDAFVPRSSVLGFLTWLAVMGSVVIGTIIGYAWACDRCESHINERIEH